MEYELNQINGLKNKIREIERSRFILYNNQEAIDFILSFFELDNKGAARCRVWTKDLESGKQIIARYGKNQKMISLGKENIMKQLFEAHTTYFYEFIFDANGIKNSFTKDQKKGQLVGISPVMPFPSRVVAPWRGSLPMRSCATSSRLIDIDDFNST